MQQIFGENYFIDFDEIEKYIDLSLKEDEIQTTGETADQRINLVKYELIKLMLDVILTENEEFDEKMAMKGSNGPSIPFKLAFNSLLNKKIINHY
jgi:hypothetical protein